MDLARSQQYVLVKKCVMFRPGLLFQSRMPGFPIMGARSLKAE